LVGGECRAAIELTYLLQHTTYSMEMASVVQLPVKGMKGEQLTAVDSITLRQRQKKGVREKVELLDAVELCMAPGELNVVVWLHGYGHTTQPQ
jgi:hypothetical protein